MIPDVEEKYFSDFVEGPKKDCSIDDTLVISTVVIQ